MKRLRFFSGMAAILALSIASAAQAGQKGEIGKTDRLLVAAQKICPVSGKDLTSMGGPVKAQTGGRTIFLCCKGCFGKNISKEHWSKVHANLIAAQGKCPVMDKPLPANPKSTVVNKRIVFVCCPPCTRKIEADPAKYLGLVDSYLEANLQGGK